MLVSFQRSSEHTGEICSKKTIELVAAAFVRG